MSDDNVNEPLESLEAWPETPKKKPGKRLGFVSVQTLELVTPTVREMARNLDSSVAFVTTAAVAKFSELPTVEQLERIQSAREAYAESLKG